MLISVEAKSSIATDRDVRGGGKALDRPLSTLFFPRKSATANPANPPTACTCIFPATTTTTWCARSTCLSRKRSSTSIDHSTHLRKNDGLHAYLSVGCHLSRLRGCACALRLSDRTQLRVATCCAVDGFEEKDAWRKHQVEPVAGLCESRHFVIARTHCRLQKQYPTRQQTESYIDRYLKSRETLDC